MPLALRMVGVLALLASALLPLGTCAEGAPLGASEFGPALDSGVTWLSLGWPVALIPLLLLVRVPRARFVLRRIEILGLVYSFVFLSPGFLLGGRPGPGFFLGLAGVLVYAIGVVLGSPPTLRRAA